MKSTTIEKFDNLCTELSNAKRAVRNQCIDMLKEICNRTESKEISLDKMNNFLLDGGLANPVFCYDGGNHPEYASNMYSAVEGFELKGDKLVFTIEDSDSYDITRVLTDCLIELCDAIVEYEKEGYELGVNEYESDCMTTCE
jgi:hypothetical protein